MTWMLKLSNHDLKAALVTMLHEAKVTTVETTNKMEIFGKLNNNNNKKKLLKMEILLLKDIISQIFKIHEVDIGAKWS